MPYQNVPDELQDKMERCVTHLKEGGEYDEKGAIAICYSSIVEGKLDAANLVGKAGFILNPIKAAIKAVGDWELDILAIPFNEPDSDGQYFDERTDIMDGSYQTPPGFYQHGVKQGAASLQEKVTVIGKTIYGTLKKMMDGWHLRMSLDPTRPESKNVMDAARNGRVAVSSDSVAHLARLEVAGKTIMYEKNRKGRISVWPLAGVSLWEMGNGNFEPASKRTFALPAMKAIYGDAGLQFPDTKQNDGDLPEAQKAANRAREIEIQKAKSFLQRTDKRF